MGTIDSNAVESILKIFSHEEHVLLMKTIANGVKWKQQSTPESLTDRFHLDKRDLNSKIEKLMTLGLVDMVNDHYCLTKLGKEIHDSLIMIEDAIRDQPRTV